MFYAIYHAIEVRNPPDAVFLPGDFKDFLSVCGGEIHESIITRGMIRNADKVHLILVPENSNLVHSDCQPESGRGSEQARVPPASNLSSAETGRYRR